MSFLKNIGLGGGDDPQFVTAKKSFEASQKSLDKINDHITAFLLQAQELLMAQKKVAEDMSTADPKALPDGMVKDNITLVEQMLLEKVRVDEDIRRGFQDPSNKYKQQYREIEERIRERHRRQEEVSKLEHEVKKYKEKSDARLAGTERRLANAKQAYEDLHHELLEDIPKLVDDKVRFFEPMVAVLIDAQIRFYQGMFGKLSDIQSRITHIDRAAAGNHPKVIRPRQESAVGRSYSAFGANSSANETSTGGHPVAVTMGGGAAPPPVPHRGLPTPGQPRAKGLWDFATAQPNELPFRAGDIVNIVDSTTGDWWTAELNGRTGLIPSNYVQLI